MNNKVLDSFTLERIRVFLISTGLVFLMSVLSHVSFDSHSSLATPLAKPDIWLNIKPRLEQKNNQFHLQKQSGLIPAAQAGAEYDQAKAYGVVDLDSGQVLLEKNLDAELPIASLTKIMTAVVAADLAPPDELFTVSEKAAQIEPTRMGVIAGQKWTRDELLTALLLTSANDAAQVLAEGIGQIYHDPRLFVQAMNEKARLLGLKKTSFENPQGFDSRYNYSSVADLTVLTGYSLTNYPIISQIVAKDYQFFPASQYHKLADLYNWNGLLGVYPGVKGVKIGNTDDAQVTTVVLSERGGHQLLAILLGAPRVLERDLWASQLLDLGFAKFGLVPVHLTENQLKAKYLTWKYFK